MPMMNAASIDAAGQHKQFDMRQEAYEMFRQRGFKCALASLPPDTTAGDSRIAGAEVIKKYNSEIALRFSTLGQIVLHVTVIHANGGDTKRGNSLLRRMTLYIVNMICTTSVSSRE